MESQKVMENPRTGPDFRHVQSWIFDLDNTLYRADNGIFAQIESRMTDYVTALLQLPRDQARIRQKELYRAYGTTLNGLMREHDVDAEDYLRFVHDIDLGALGPDAELAAALAKLPGRRFVFTNGCRGHAARILDRLQMAHLFDDVWDIRTINFTPKPHGDAYASVVRAGGIEPAEAAMFEDLARNLVPARAMGMTTIWLKTDAPWGKHGPLLDVAPGDIDHETEDLAAFLNSIRI
ncbi:MAG: pyrimidine 5-nucleotidase [Alphaproteobacteria bacterium]|nr:pyrimidine 5-nucleotidase [Alphaproteobacteria bacterium]